MKKLKWILIISVIGNVVFITKYGIDYINTPNYKFGILQKDIKVGVITNNKETLFTLPKGITVRNVSPTGINAIGQFEAKHFEIVITTDRDDLINYRVDESKIYPFGNYYTADSDKEYN